jgi:acyl-CoA hydrolase
VGRTPENWRERVAGRLVSLDEAVRVVRDGDKVWCGGWTSVPVDLCKALAARHRELRDVTIHTFLSPFPWDRPELLESFRIVTSFVGPHDRAAVREGRIDYTPIAQFRAGQAPPGADLDFDVAMIPISPPDDEGWCSFGGAVWFGPTMAARSKRLIGEVHPEFIRTGGGNRIHVSRFERLAEAAGREQPATLPPRSQETAIATEVICTLLAFEVVPDGATLQIGVGDVSAALPVFLGHRRDLGIHTEILPGGVAELMRQGVVNGRYKTVRPGKVVASALVQMPPEELALLDGHPDLELYDFTETDDLATLLRLENFFAVNNALAVDLTGNACSEAHGPRMYSGPGGQPTFAIAASITNGGSVIVLPSSQTVGGERISRIVAAHPAGSTITVHRGYVDTVVTEQGIARLRGKSLRQRIDEMISVAHPDFRNELRREARRLYGLG